MVLEHDNRTTGKRVTMISIRHLITFSGPSPFSGSPVVVAGITLPEDGTESAGRLFDACTRLRETFGEWIAELPDRHLPLAEVVGSILGQWALGALNEVRGFLHETGFCSSPGGAVVWAGYHLPGISFSALELAVEALLLADSTDGFARNDFSKRLDRLLKQCRSRHPDYQVRILMEGARSLDIPFLRFIPETRFWQFGWGSRAQLFFETMSNRDGVLGVKFEKSKALGKAVFSALGFPTPPYRLVSRNEDLAEAAQNVGWPCVVKPLAGGKGAGVTTGIQGMREMEAAFECAKMFSGGEVLIEKHVSGNDYRLTVINGKLVAAIRREPAAVTGDGKKTVQELVETLNSGRSDNIVKSRFLAPVPIDASLELHLSQQGCGFGMVLESGRRITLRSNANRSSGGSCYDETGRVHPDVKLMAEAVAATMGLASVGLDYISHDIGCSWHDGGALIEANSTPGLGPMIAAGYDPAWIGSIVLGDLPGRIPFHLAIVGEEDFPGVEESLGRLLVEDCCGLACGKEAWMGRMRLNTLPGQPWPGVDALLRNRTTTRIYAVCSAGELMRHGMPVDRADSVALCGELPLIEEWLDVLSGHSGTVERYCSWDSYCSGQNFFSDSEI
jgi:cyanophycin synthetase